MQQKSAESSHSLERSPLCPTHYVLVLVSGAVKLCGVVWCGVVWCGVVWCGVVWCGILLMTGDCLRQSLVIWRTSRRKMNRSPLCIQSEPDTIPRRCFDVWLFALARQLVGDLEPQESDD
jgi:hypothetical protein